MEHLSKWWEIVKEFVVKYWTICIEFVNEKVGFDVIDAIAKSTIVVKGKEVFASVYMYIRPEAIYTILDTLRLSLQINEFVRVFNIMLFVGWTLF